MPQVGTTTADVPRMVLVTTLVLVSWLVLPLPFAIAVGRAFEAGERGPVPPSREPATTGTGSAVPVLGELAV